MTPLNRFLLILFRPWRERALFRPLSRLTPSRVSASKDIEKWRALCPEHPVFSGRRSNNG